MKHKPKFKFKDNAFYDMHPTLNLVLLGEVLDGKFVPSVYLMEQPIAYQIQVNAFVKQFV